MGILSIGRAQAGVHEGACPERTRRAAPRHLPLSDPKAWLGFHAAVCATDQLVLAFPVSFPRTSKSTSATCSLSYRFFLSQCGFLLGISRTLFWDGKPLFISLCHLDTTILVLPEERRKWGKTYHKMMFEEILLQVKRSLN